jgi:hypothetical protein
MTITQSRLGLNGRLGNQMFQFAALLSLAKRHNVKPFLPIIHYGNAGYVGNEFLRMFDGVLDSAYWLEETDQYSIEYKKNIKTFFNEGFQFSYQKEFEQLPQNIDINGYFQSEKYFLNVREELLQIFSFQKERTDAFIKELDNIKNSNKKTCSVHLRRTDYVNLSDFHANLCSTNYYQDAFDFLNVEDMNLFVFTDDEVFSKSFIGAIIPLDNVMFVNNFIPAPEAIYLQSFTDYSIIANSSFSWWGAWLGKTKQAVVAPRYWFGPKGPTDTQDLYAEKWIKL